VAQSDYSSVTEVAGTLVTREQIQRMYTRYRFAAGFCKGKDVLECACGSGQGLGYLAREAALVAGGDIDPALVARAQRTYAGKPNITVSVLDAQALPLPDSSTDVVIMFEALYYLPAPERFISEAARVMRPGGTVLICSANPSLPDFNPSPFSHRYFSVRALARLLSDGGFSDIAAYGDCPVHTGPKAALVSCIKKTAVALHLVPKTMKGKELFKRIFYGTLVAMPDEITGEGMDYSGPSRIDIASDDLIHKVIFAKGIR
jgi:SAM-dependent methyltransferase